MMRRMALAAVLVAALAMAVLAGDMPKGTAGGSPMEAMKAGMMKCTVCKHIAMRMDEIGPMGMESVKLNDGVAINHWVQGEDPKRIAAFHAACNAANQAGQACMTMTDEQAKTDLCEFCQSIRSAAKAGARFSSGETRTGDMMVLTSSDPAVQGQLASLHEKCAMMAASMEKPAKTSASK